MRLQTNVLKASTSKIRIKRPITLGPLKAWALSHKIQASGILVVICAVVYLLVHQVGALRSSNVSVYWLPDRATRRAVDVNASAFSVHLALIDKSEKSVVLSGQGTVFSTSAKNKEAITFFEAPRSAYDASSCPNVLHVSESPGQYQQAGSARCEKIGSTQGNDVYRIIYTGGGPAPQAVFTTRDNVFIAFVIPDADSTSDPGSIFEFIKLLKPIASKDLPNWLAKNAQAMAGPNKQVDDYQAAVPLAYTKLGFTVYKPVPMPSEWEYYLLRYGGEKDWGTIYGPSPTTPQAYVLHRETPLPGKHDIAHSNATADLSIIEYSKKEFSYTNGKCGRVPSISSRPAGSMDDRKMIDCTPRNGSYVSSLPTGGAPYRVFHIIGDTVVMLELSTSSVGGNADLSPEIINSLDSVIAQLKPVDTSSLKDKYTFYRESVF